MAKKLSPDYIEWVLTLNAKQVQEEYHKLNKENQELQAQTNATRKKMAELESQGKKGSVEWTNLRKSIEQNSRAMSANRSKMAELSKHMDLSAMSVKELKKKLRDLKREFEATSKSADPKRYKELREQINRTQAALDKADASARGLRGGFFSLTKMKQTLIGFFNGIGLAILGLVVGAFKNAFDIVVEFEKANSKLAGILGTSREGIKELTAAARQLGATTAYTAAEVTGLQIELAKLGFGQDQILKMEGAVLKFAKAVDTDLASAAAFAGAALRIFGKDASETEDVLATFAVATTKTALDFSKLQASLSTVGPVAHAFGLSIEDTTALLGQLANAGFDASSAATATRNIILNLCDANGDLAKALGGPVKNADDLAKGLKKLNDEGVDLAKALDLTDKRSVAAFSTFLASADSLTSLRDSISGVNEQFNQMSATMSDNVAGAMAGLQSAAQELVLKISEGTEGPIKDLIKALTSLVQTIGKVIDFTHEHSGVISFLAKTFLFYKGAVIASTTAIKAYTVAQATMGKALTTFRLGLNAVSGAQSPLIALFKKGTLAVKSFGSALKLNPWGIALTALTLIGPKIYEFVKGSESVNHTMNNVSEALGKANLKYEEQRQKLLKLRETAMDNNAAFAQRQKAITELNKIIPGYNASLDAESRKYRENKKALDEYLSSLREKLIMEANREKYLELLKKEQDFKAEKYKEWLEERENKAKFDAAVAVGNQLPEGALPVKPRGSSPEGGMKNTLPKNVQKYDPDATFEDWYSRYDRAGSPTADRREFETYLKKTKQDAALAAKEAGDALEKNVVTPTGKAAENVDKTVKRLGEIKERLKELRNASPSTKEELLANIAERDKLQAEKRTLEGKPSKGKNRHETGTYGDGSIEEVTNPIDDKHQRKLLEINADKGKISDAELLKKTAEETIRYCDELNTALQKLRDETDKSHTQTLDKISKQQTEAATKSQDATQQLNKALDSIDKSAHASRLEAAETFYNNLADTMRRNVAEQKTDAEAAELYIEGTERQAHAARLTELKRYLNQVKDADYLGAEEKKARADELQKQIRAAQNQVLTDTGNWAKKLRELTADSSTLEGFKASVEAQVKSVSATYDVAIKIAKLRGDDTVALEQAKNRKIEALNYSLLEKQYEIQQLNGASWAQEYDHELAQLEHYHRQGLIKEKDYQAKKLQLGADNAKKYFDYYANLSGSMFTAIQDAEIATSDAKYDVLIQQAKNNGEETAALEQEKENKKLEIQKKYADVDFAMKVSQIIADTAVAIMKAFADLGPIGGAVAAAMLTATGLAQVASAKAERDKVKNMQPGNVNAATGNTTEETPMAKRELTGYSEGGYTGPGDRYEVAGVVHRDEYVVPKPIMNNPRVIDAVGTIEAIRRNKIAGAGAMPTTAVTGYADGGQVGAAPAFDTSELSATIKELRAAIANMKAYVVLRDIDKARNQLDRARAPFTR